MRRRSTAAVIAIATLALSLMSARKIQGLSDRQDDYKDIGKNEKGTQECNDQFFASSRCPGKPDFDLWNVINASPNARKLAAKWMKERKFEVASGVSERLPASGHSGGTPQRLTVQVIRKTRSTNYTKLGGEGFVVAHITGDPTAMQDDRYGIGVQTEEPYKKYKLTTDYFLVIDKFDTSDVSGTDSRKISTWRIFGIDTSDGTQRLVQLGATGSFRWCRFDHTELQKKSEAHFVSCDIARTLHDLGRVPRVRAALGDRSAIERFIYIATVLRGAEPAIRASDAQARSFLADRLAARDRSIVAALDSTGFDKVKVLVEELAESPAWVTCGGGCCTADNI